MKNLFGYRRRAATIAAVVLAAGQSAALANDLHAPGTHAGQAPAATVEIAQALRIDHLRGLAVGQPTVVAGVPIDGRALDLELERFDIWTPDGVFIHNNQEVARPSVTLLRGRVAGEPDSHVVIGIGDHATNGFIRSGSNVYSLSTGGRAETDLLRAANIADFRFKNDRPGCGIGDHNRHAFNPAGVPVTIDVSDAAPDTDTRGTTCRVVRVAIDSDYEWTLEVFGGNGLASAEYAMFLMAAVSEVYQRDMNVRLVVPYLRTFSDNVDPYTGGTSPDPLDQVMDHWNNNLTNVERETVHLFTGANTQYGGIAYVGVICNRDFGYGVSAYMDGSFPYPLQENSYSNWDLVVSAHELGHNFGTFHTHDGYEPPIDRCGIDCTGNLNGTIMSYCHICSGGLINIDLRFHPIVQGAVENYLAGLGCNLTPVAAANPDSADTQLETPVDIYVLANDSGANCNDVGIASFDATSANGGTVTLQGWNNPTGDLAGRFLRYTPAAGYSGLDTFNYTTTAGQTTQVTIDIEGFRAADVVTNPQPGLTSAYYSISPFTGNVPDFTGLTPVEEGVVSRLNYASTSGNAVGGPLANNVGAEFNGYLIVPQQGVYTLSLESDDGSLLFIGDELVVNNDGLHGMQVRSGTIGLEPGAHELRVGFFEAGGGAGLIMSWSGPGVFSGVVPSSNLVHAGTVNCGPADLAEPFGVLDLADVSGFVSAFVNQQPPADLADPFGTFDLADIATFVASFNAGCP